ncbi:Ammonia transport outward protein 2 [Spathaspora sp. JA1]|nr:Ammonia transport outward protein 2 [Spathaspora sp. JA1]
MASIISSVSVDSYSKPVPIHNDELKIQKTVSMAGSGNEFVIIGDNKYYRHELMQAFGGTFTSGLTPYPKHQIGNPAALGLFATHMNIFVLGLIFAGATGGSIPNAAVGLFIFVGGILQFLAGVWCLVAGNTLGATAFTSYGSFWLSFGAIFIPGFGIGAAYADDPEQLNQGIGLISVGWAIFTTMLLVCLFKSTLSFFFTVLTLDLTIILLAAGFLSGSPKVMKAGGIMGVINACVGWFECYAGIATKQNSYLVPKEIPLPDLSKR